MPIPEFKRNFNGAINLAHYLVSNKWWDPNDIQSVNLARSLINDGTWSKEDIEKFDSEKTNYLQWFRDKVETEKKKDVVYTFLDYIPVSTLIERETCYEILIPDNAEFNTCHQNFAVCKELCHILSDEGKYKSRDPLPSLLRALEISDEIRDPRSVIFLITEELKSAEDFCFLLAMELLIPVGVRKGLLQQFSDEREAKKIMNDDMLRDAALPLLIPRKILKFFILSDYYSIYLLHSEGGFSEGSIPPSLGSQNN